MNRLTQVLGVTGVRRGGNLVERGMKSGRGKGNVAVREQLEAVRDAEPTARLPRWAWLCAVLAIVATAVLLWPEHGRPLGWDEVDYASAAKLGVISNLFDRGSLSPPDYVRFAADKWRGDPQPRLPANYNERSDPLVLRHYHPPAVPYAMAALSFLHGDRGVRAVQLVGAIALVLIGLFCYWRTSRQPTALGTVLVLVGLSWASWQLFRYLQFHGWETVSVFLVGLSLLGWARGDHSRSQAVKLCASLAFAILALQSGVFLFVPVAVCVLLVARRDGIRSPWAWLRSYLLPGFLLVTAFVVVAWPGTVFKISAVKIALQYVYLIVRGQEYASNETGAGSPIVLVPLAVALAAIIYLVARRRDEIASWGPWALLGCTYTTVIFRVALDPRYLLPGIVPLFIVVAYAVDSLRVDMQVTVASVLLVVLAVGFLDVVRTNHSDVRADEAWRTDLEFLRARLAGTPSLMDGGHILRYYLHYSNIEDIAPSYDQASLFVRRRGAYYSLTNADLAGKYVGVLRSRHEFFRGAAERTLAARCPMIERSTFWIWDCTALSPSG